MIEKKNGINFILLIIFSYLIVFIYYQVGNAESYFYLWIFIIFFTSLTFYILPAKGKLYLYISIMLFMGSLISIDYSNWFYISEKFNPNPFTSFPIILLFLYLPFCLNYTLDNLKFTLAEKLLIMGIFTFLFSFLSSTSYFLILRTILTYLLPFLFLSVLLKSKRIDNSLILFTILYSISIIVYISLIMNFYGADIKANEENGFFIYRLFGLGGALHPNRFAALINIAILINLFIMIKNRKLNILINLIILFYSLVLTRSRMGIISLSLGIIVFGGFLSKRKFATIIFLTTIFILVLTNQSVMNFLYRGDPESIKNFSSRTDIWSYIFNNIFNNPYILIFGIGIREIENYNASRFINFSHAHNSLIQMVLDGGILNLILFLASLILVFKNLLEKIKQKKDEYTILYFTIIIVILLFSLSEPLLAGTYNPIIFLYHLFFILSLR